MKKSKIIVIIIVLFLAVGGFGYFYYKGKPASTGMSGMGMAPADSSTTPPIVTKDGTVTLSERARQVAGVQTSRAAVRTITKTIKTTGKVVMNETRRAYITSRVEGRIDVLYISTEGEFINTGQIVARVYSPAYSAAQEEYLHALENREAFGNAGQDAANTNEALTTAARRKLQLLNVSENDILELEQSGKAKDLMPVYAQFSGIVLERQVLPGGYIRPGDKLFSIIDLSTVWINTDIYEKDIANVRLNEEVVISSQAYPGETFNGKIVFVNPILDDATRTVKVRVELDNRKGMLKPNMFVNATIKVPLGESLVIPESAILDHGEEQVVFLAQDKNVFVRRNVVAGQYANGYVQIVSGLQSDDYVVIAAAFLLDSQTKLGGFSSHGGHGGSGNGHN
ncbi:efflux RND transporter periplasmic adaptor subunit [Treponema primitia]|uniref:efflux RND transporter periplasmic adaptor subunit n=1 Tax=Treponema primitia TaxID=88058 RepID=UPI00397ED4A6